MARRSWCSWKNDIERRTGSAIARSVFNEAPEGTGREEAIQHLAMSGYHLQPGQEIAGEAGWPPEVLRQVRSRQFDRNLRRSWQAPCVYSVPRPAPLRHIQDVFSLL